MKKLFVLFLVLTMGVLIFAGCSGSSKTSGGSPQNASQKVVKGSVNETVTLPDDTAITVKRVLKNPEDSKMLLIAVEIKNESNVPKVYGIQNFLLKDENGNTYTPAIAKVPNPILTTNVLPGKTLSGFLGFNVPESAGNLTLVFQGATGKIEVQIQPSGE